MNEQYQPDEEISPDGEDAPEAISEEFSEEEAERARMERDAILASFGDTISKMRDEAVKGRAASGIEEEWLEDEEHYEGIDDANRGEMPRKSVSMAGSVRLSGNDAKPSGTRSTIFLNITRPYVDAASARVSDMLLPTDDRNWAIRPTPLPSLIQATKDEHPAIDANGQQVMREPNEAEKIQGQQQGVMPQQVPATVKDLAQQALNQAKDQAEKAQTRIDDWLSECQYHAEVRQMIEDSSRIGSGVLKGPFPKIVKRKAMVKAMEGAGLMLKQEILPHSKRIDVWNFYPDPSCGDNIHNGKYVFEYDEMTARQLMELKGLDGYLEEAINEILKEGPKSRQTGMTAKQDGRVVSDKDRYEVWYFHGYVDAEDLESAGCECEEGAQVPAIVTMVNDRVIKAAMSPLDSGEFPYDVMNWQRRAGHWAGIGVSRQMRTCQRGVNAAARNLMDNAGLSAGPQIVIDRNKIEPADGNWTVGPRKIWWTTDAADLSSARDAFMVVQINSLQQELVNILQLFMKFAEDVTGLPMLIQGQLGRAPDTVGGMTMLNNNATSVLRRIARTFDDRVTEPHIGRYYEWLLMYGTDDEEKGDFTIDARGSSALIERDQQNQAMMGLVGAALDPAYGLDPELVMKEALKAQRLDPNRLELSDEKKQAMAAQQPPPAPAVQAAQIREQGAAARTQMTLEAGIQKTQMELQADAIERDKDRMLEQLVKNVEAQINAAELAGEREINMDNMRAMLTREAAKLRTQRELAYNAGRAAPQVAVPAMEPPGRAPAGQAFQR